MASTLPPPSTRVTRSRNGKSAVRNPNRMRHAMAERLVLTATGTSPKRAALAMGLHPSNVSRRLLGAYETAAERATEHYRTLAEKGLGYGTPQLVIALAVSWEVAARQWDDAELEARLAGLWRDAVVTHSEMLTARLGGVDELEAILAHASRVIQLYALTAEMQLRREGSA